ncbi:ABC transporter permease [Sneathiella glossodoripedis]|uniref:ABC transporter permease n=1 Tax=Sneathiella glossodoripedis TaxID=418853 RepID=UPI00046F336B|nr:ABC transporter permease [Sneathiella glossodoripedis]
MSLSLSQKKGLSLPKPRDLARYIFSLPFAYVGTVLLLLFAYYTRPALLSPLLLLLIIRQAAPLGIVVLGQSLCMRVLSLDLSIGGVIVAVSYILTSGVLPFSEPVLVLICVGFGLMIGSINALLITRLRASSVIVTLAMAMILSGIVISLSQYHAPSDAPEILRYIGQKRIGVFPIALFVWLAVLIPSVIFLRISVFGRYVDAIGANPNAAWTSGIPYIWVVTIVHIMSSLFAVFSGLLLVGFVGVGSIDIGQDLALNSLAAVILGGVTFGSGKGGVIGPTVAAFMLTFSFNLLTSLGLGEPGKLMIQGGIIAVAAIVYATRQAK